MSTPKVWREKLETILGDHAPGYAPRRSFSPITVKDIRLAQIAISQLKQKYDLSETEAHLLVYAGDPFIDQYGRVAE